jgi:hypothetical protein
MGFTPPSKIYVLQFEQYEGLEVKVSGTSAGGYLDLVGLVDTASADIGKARPLLELFAQCLRSWNIEDEDGRPVPQTIEGLLSLELDFVLELAGAWTDAIAGVSADLKERSNSGMPSLVESIPMETLSGSQAS